VGTFPSKREILDNDISLEVYEKYYKYTSVTNSAGDFMIFGVPVGNHTLNVDVDLSDIGLFSQKPYDMIEQGNPKELFRSGSQFKGGKNLNHLAQIKNQQIGVNVMPFWGDKKTDEVGISRVDVDLNYQLSPKAIFIGSNITDTEKNSINKNCKTRKNAGKICEMTPGDGIMDMIRKTPDNKIERFTVGGGDVIDDEGSWAYQIPMNLDYMITDEFGKLVPTEEPNKGIPTRASVRFKLDPLSSGDEGRLRTRASYLIPHNPNKNSEVDYEFGEETKDYSFRDLYWNKIYTVKNFIPRFQTNNNFQSRRFTGFKDVDDCAGVKNPPPFNRMDTDFNPLFTIACILIGIIVEVIALINSAVSLDIPAIGRICDVKNSKIRCTRVQCKGQYYAPKCNGSCYNYKGDNERTEPFEDDKDALVDCYQGVLAEALNVYEFDFYNDWVNGTVYSLLLKYKKRKEKDKFCDLDKDFDNNIHDTMIGNNHKQGGHEVASIDGGIIKQYNDDFFYSPLSNDGQYKLMATDIVCLGSAKKYDWQGFPVIHNYITPTSYNVPPFTQEEGDESITPMIDYNGTKGLLFDLKCKGASVDPTQAINIKRICEIGVGLDEDRFDEPNGTGKDGEITKNDIENQFVRDAFIMMNSADVDSLPDNGLTSYFDGSHYSKFRNYNGQSVSQPENSFYFYFGINPSKSAISKMNKMFFEPCVLNNNKGYGEK
jgi:hypothetical protein